MPGELERRPTMGDIDDSRIGAFFVRLWALSFGVPVLIDVLGRLIDASTASPGAEADRQRLMVIAISVVAVVYLGIGWPQRLH